MYKLYVQIMKKENLYIKKLYVFMLCKIISNKNLYVKKLVFMYLFVKLKYKIFIHYTKWYFIKMNADRFMDFRAESL